MLKRETRILGLSGTTICHKTIIASVVFRGSLWLDGFSTTMIEAKDRNIKLQVANLIKNSKQFSQLHAIIISQRLNLQRAISIHYLARSVKLPVIAIKSQKRSRRGNHRVNKIIIWVSGKHVAATFAGTDRAHAEKLYKISCSPNRELPEAVRVADLLTEEISRKFKCNVKTPGLHQSMKTTNSPKNRV